MEKIRDTKDTEGEFLKNFDDDDNLLQDNRNKTTKKCAIISIIAKGTINPLNKPTPKKIF